VPWLVTNGNHNVYWLTRTKAYEAEIAAQKAELQRLTKAQAERARQMEASYLEQQAADRASYATAALQRDQTYMEGLNRAHAESDHTVAAQTAEILKRTEELQEMKLKLARSQVSGKSELLDSR
jgi:hypothetical protein